MTHRNQHADTIREALEHLVSQDRFEKPYAWAAQLALTEIFLELEQAAQTITELYGVRLAYLERAEKAESLLREVRDMDPNVIAVVDGGLHERIREALAE